MSQRVRALGLLACALCAFASSQARADRTMPFSAVLLGPGASGLWFYVVVSNPSPSAVTVETKVSFHYRTNETTWTDYARHRTDTIGAGQQTLLVFTDVPNMYGSMASAAGTVTVKSDESGNAPAGWVTANAAALVANTTSYYPINAGQPF